MFYRTTIKLFFLFCCFSFSVNAENSDKKKSDASWTPTPVKFDWLQLTSREWLKGEVKSMYRNNLIFESDELDTLSIKWDKVKYLQTHSLSTVRIESAGTYVGKLTVTDDKVTITTADGEKEFSRHDVISVTPAGDRELDLWIVRFSLGLNGRSGNTKQIDYSGKISAKRNTAKSRLSIDYIGNISKTDSLSDTFEESLNNHRLNLGLDVGISRYFFYQPINLEYFSDPFQNIDQKITAGTGIGYILKDSDTFEWMINTGPAYSLTEFVSVQSGEDAKTKIWSLAAGTKIEYEITKKLDFSYKYNMQFSKDALGGYNHNMVASLESEITGNLDFDVSLIWDRINNPIVNENQVTPEKDDYRLILSLSYSL